MRRKGWRVVGRQHGVDPSVRFWAKVNKRGPIPAHRPALGRCWLWTAALGKDGYGVFGVSPGKLVRAHRYAYRQLRGPIPAGREPDHLCFVKACINPDHVEMVTHKVNTRRAWQRSPWNTSTKTAAARKGNRCATTQ